MEKLNIYSKLHQIQTQIKELTRTEENKFQKYFFFNELQVLQLLKPLLEKYKLTLLLSDDISQPFLHEKDGKEHYVKYLKKLEIVDAENPDQKLSFNFWAGGQNTDLAKAKGSAETYATKYLLTKFFLIPVKDEGDPDYKDVPKKEQENFNKKANFLFTDTEPKKVNSINDELISQLISLFRQKTADQKERQDNFLTKLDQCLAKQGITGKTETTATSFQSRLSLLTPLHYQDLANWLLKFEEEK